MKNKHLIYRKSFETEQKALEFCNSLKNKGVVQQVGNFWQVWQFVSFYELAKEAKNI